VKNIFIAVSSVNFILATLSFLGKIVEKLNPNLYHNLFGTFVVWIILGFILTWPFNAILGIGYGLIFSELNQNGERSMYCLSCRYRLAELSGPRCPECGRPFDPNDVRTFQRYINHTRNIFLVLSYCWLVVGGAAVACLVAGILKFIFP
jgi:hypothetical protein